MSSGDRHWRRLAVLFPALLAAVLAVGTAVPQYSPWAGVAAPVVLMAGLTCGSYLDYRRAQRAGAALRDKLDAADLELAGLENQLSSPPTASDPMAGFDQKAEHFGQALTDLENRLSSGLATPDEARELWQQLAQVPLPGTRTPAQQLEEVAREYGLPVNLAPSASGGNPVNLSLSVSGPVRHVCPDPRTGAHRYYTSARYCPDHKWTVIIPARKSHALTCTCRRCTSAGAQDLLARMRQGRAAAVERYREALYAEAQAAPETRPEDLLPDPVTAADEAVADYVPEGEAELLEHLRRHLKRQWDEAPGSREKHAVPFPGYWEMSPAWADDVRKLRDLAGGLVWKPDSCTLYGYCVKIDIAYGAPELKGA